MYFDNNTLVFLSGGWIPASEARTSLYSQTLHYGNGVFEGIRAYDTTHGARVFKAREHYERLLFSAEKMHIRLDYGVEELVSITYELLAKNQLKDAYIRPLVYLNPNMSLLPAKDRGQLFIAAWKWGKLLGDRQLKVCTSSFQRPNPRSCFVQAKTVGHYTNSVLATTEAKHKGFDEALLTDQNGFVAEGPGANFFFEKDGTLYTCPPGNILPGITRDTIIQLAGNLGIPVKEKLFTTKEVKAADSAFFTGTAAEVAAIGSLDEYHFPCRWESSLGCVLSRAYQNLVRMPVQPGLKRKIS